jgi:pyrimidine-nucleoside phosphorylase
VTATVGSVPLIAASVMSKKLAGGAGTILLDIKTGSGAFMKELDGARALARACLRLGEAAGRTTGALITDMSQPLSEMIGNAIEVREVIEVLQGKRTGRFADLCVELAGALAWFAGVAESQEDGTARARDALVSGAALERFARFLEAQGGDPRTVEDPGLLPAAPVVHEITAHDAGWLEAVDAEALGFAAARLGAGRARKEDAIDPAVGIELITKLGQRTADGELIARVYARTEEAARGAEPSIRAALRFADTETQAPPLVHEVMPPAG